MRSPRSSASNGVEISNVSRLPVKMALVFFMVLILFGWKLSTTLALAQSTYFG